MLACARGEMSAWDTLIHTYQPLVHSLACRLVGQDEAEDITQEVFLRAFKALHTFRGDSQLSTWIYRIAVNLCRDRARYSKRRPVAFSLDEPLLSEEGEVGRQIPDQAPSVDEHVQTRELSEQVELALSQLPSFHRSVLVLHDMQGLRYEEVAQVLGCSLGTVKSRLFYARRKMEKLLGNYVAG